ncbi:MAG: competence/damage-inducible protein A [Candidatus Aminicenantes bacterium]|nr:MAG: competence/damage-inducible protein A [Candidatus Aminicenantes bacterium]
MKSRSKKYIEYIATGSELLSPGFIETNSSYLAGKLEELGWKLNFKTIVSDRLEEIKLIFQTAQKRSWLIFISGGLGPTEDDRTRQAVAEILKRRLVFHKEILKNIRKRFESRGLTMTPSNRRQAYIIDGATILENPNGTAPGMWLEIRGQIIILLPGPPSELKPMVDNLVFPKLKPFQRRKFLQAVLRITGAGESWIEDRIKLIYSKLPKKMELTTLASPGDVQIRLSMPTGRDEEKDQRKLEEIKKEILNLLENKVYSTDGQLLEQVIGQKLTANKMALACAESCSGGLLANRITNVPGSSNYFLEGLVTYSNRAKVRELGVPEELIKAKGAVSEEVAAAMAKGVREKAGADIGLSTTGIAGPGGGTMEKPVGLVYIGLASSDGVKVERCLFKGQREQIKYQATQKALDMLRLKLMEIEKGR